MRMSRRAIPCGRAPANRSALRLLDGPEPNDKTDQANYAADSLKEPLCLAVADERAGSQKNSAGKDKD